MKSINLVLWAVSLALQSLLVVMLFRRRLVRTVPIFTGLIAFYALRSAVLYILSSFSDAGNVRNVYDALSTVDLLLQIALFLEITRRSVMWSRDAVRQRWEITAIQLVVEGVIAGGVTYFMPETTRVPVDRGVVFVTVLMILQLAWIAWHRVSGVPRAICAGFAVFGLAATAAVFVQNTAVEHREATTFAVAAYSNALVYIGIVVFWILALREGKADPRRAGLASRRRAGLRTASSE